MHATNPTIYRMPAAVPAVMAATTDNVVRPYRTNLVAAPAFPAGSEVKTWPNDRGVTDLNNTLWVNPGKFQIISAGMDGKFGIDNVQTGTLVFKQFPAPNYYASGSREADEDNLADFSEGQTIGDSIP
jgi:hypothetical protein